jgi:hypothetical protein
VKTLVIEDRYGWLPVKVGDVTKDVDLLATWWALKAIYDDTRGQPNEAFYTRVAAYVEELGFGRVTSQVADLFASGIMEAMDEARKGTGTQVVEEAKPGEPVEFTRVVVLANLAAAEPLPPVPDGFTRSTIATVESPPGTLTVTYRDAPTQ